MNPFARAALALLLSGCASRAAAITIHPFPLPSPNAGASGITVGPDGNLWFTEWSGHRIGRMTLSGEFTEFPLPSGDDARPNRIVAGPDGNLWYTDLAGRLGRVSPEGAVTEFELSTWIGGIAAGPDGNIWFAAGFQGVGRATTQGTVTFFRVDSPMEVLDVTAGPDGNVWFTEVDGSAVHTAPAGLSLYGAVGRITPDGTITEFPLDVPNGPGRITLGPDGRLWFSTWNGLGRITVRGDVDYETFGGTPWTTGPITRGPDGSCWFTRLQFRDGGGLIPTVGRARPGGKFEEWSGWWGLDMVTGPDRNVWIAGGGALYQIVVRTAHRE